MTAWGAIDRLPMEHGVRLAEAPAGFATLYAEARERERRLLSDAQVARLPDGRGLWNAAEWRIRARSARRLASALREQGKALRVLEVGCGNGWLSGFIADAKQRVLGIDACTDELEQAARVFPSVTFARADLHCDALPAQGFDALVFAASIQYFSDVHAAVARAMELLAPGGRIHVFDSVLYPSESEAAEARERTRAYYDRLGVPRMAEHYHAHALGDFRRHGATVLHAPGSRATQWLRLHASPFTHLVIRKKD